MTLANALAKARLVGLRQSPASSRAEGGERGPRARPLPGGRCNFPIARANGNPSFLSASATCRLAAREDRRGGRMSLRLQASTTPSGSLIRPPQGQKTGQLVCYPTRTTRLLTTLQASALVYSLRHSKLVTRPAPGAAGSPGVLKNGADNGAVS